MQINLITPKEVTKAARPSLIVVGTHSILGFFEVNGLATEASAFDKDIPEFAAFSFEKNFLIKIFFKYILPNLQLRNHSHHLRTYRQNILKKKLINFVMFERKLKLKK